MATIPRRSAVWDERRNTSRAHAPSPTALRDALQVCERLRQTEPALVRWVLDGHPLLTEAEHVARFGEPYEKARRRR